ncbi:MAG: cation:dicarboxylase symporter family transporter, partial [Pseudohongiellaceae bacterium]
MTGLLLLNLTLFLGFCLFLFRLRHAGTSLSRQVFTGLLAGVVYGFYLQIAFSDQPQLITDSLAWINIVGGGYVNLLRMIIMPLVLVMMISAVLRLESVASLGKVGGLVIGSLIITTVIAALVGAGVAIAFGLDAEGMVAGTRELARLTTLDSRLETVSDLSLPEMLVSFVSTNIFYDLTGARSTSIIAVVIFGMAFGLAALMVAREDSDKGEHIKAFMDAFQAVIMKLVHLVMMLTPYGILALISNVVAVSNADDILNLLGFVVASYLAIAIMFLIHAVIITLTGTSAVKYFKLVWPVLTFAFATRSSAATIPLNVETQVEKLHVPPAIADVSATFGATIGQNGCAGIYPAMLAVMVAPSMGVDPLDLTFLLSLAGIVAISSFGIAGVGGGATYAALVVLPALGFPVTLVALLISIEPLIDMARTALN